jgi:O-acetyl-ADP-ribose deacetylase (regulator of RNase III)
LRFLEKIGNILDITNITCICHIVNCKGVMGAGLAKEIRDCFPNESQPYFELCERNNKIFRESSELLGTALIIDGFSKRICHLFAQDEYGRTKRHLNYEALYVSLESLRNQLKDNQNTVLAFPKNMGCGLAGGNWTIVKTVIYEIFKDTDFDIIIVDLAA